VTQCNFFRVNVIKFYKKRSPSLVRSYERSLVSDEAKDIDICAAFAAENVLAPAQELLITVRPNFATEFRHTDLNRKRDIAKRAMDILLGTCLIVLLLPVLILVAVIIKIDSPGPALFFQARGGLHGIPFQIAKFRTMSVLENHSNIEQAKLDDPRITRIGHCLRRMRIDELPQLFNVLAGQMSLVGPRPHALAHDILFAKLLPNYSLRQRLKPGITGWAQVNHSHGAVSDSDALYRRIEHDLWYIERASILLDLRILVATIPKVFS